MFTINQRIYEESKRTHVHKRGMQKYFGLFKMLIYGMIKSFKLSILFISFFTEVK